MRRALLALAAICALVGIAGCGGATRTAAALTLTYQDAVRAAAALPAVTGPALSCAVIGRSFPAAQVRGASHDGDLLCEWKGPTTTARLFTYGGPNFRFNFAADCETPLTGQVPQPVKGLHGPACWHDAPGSVRGLEVFEGSYLINLAVGDHTVAVPDRAATVATAVRLGL